MAGPEDFGARDRPHISISRLREEAIYAFPSRKQDRKPLREDYSAHATQLLDQLAIALGNLPEPNQDPRLRVEGLKPGAVVEVDTLPPSETSRVKATKIPGGLEFPAQDIVVLRSDRNDDRTESALVFIPDDARQFLRARIQEYGRVDIGNQRRRDVDKFEVLETVSAGTAEALFVGEVDFASRESVWWELWVRGSAAFATHLAGVARNQNLDVHANRLIFPDTTVLFIHANAQAIFSFVSKTPGAINEIRQATGTIEPFLERGDANRLGQEDWVRDLAGRIEAAGQNSPAICALDTGVSAEHPLIAPGLKGAWAFDAAWGTDDHIPNGGHGTGLAGLVLYGDLEPLMNDRRAVSLTHDVESMKLLPPEGFPPAQPPSYGVITQGAVASVEVARPNITRAFCLAISTTDFPSSRPSSWSGALDQIAAGSMPGEYVALRPASQSPKRLIAVATGNVDGGMLVDVVASQPLEDPAQSWNAITIGGITTKDSVPVPPPELTPVVTANERSPFSRGSLALPDDLTPVKPEVLFEAGNMLADDTGFCGWAPSVSLLATGSDIHNEPLIPFWATSASVAVAGNFFGRLQAALPGLWPETYRALAVDSAQWPQPIRKRVIGRGAHWKTGTKTDKQRFLREVGYGVPDVERAMLSARNDVTMIAEAELQPFAAGADGRSAVFHDMHFYDLPWPREALEKLENEVVTMKVTLSYFIEPNLAGRAATRPETYRSFGLRFEMKRRTETKNQFRSRLSANQDEDRAEAEPEKSCWLLGPKSIQAGSLHCDLWRGRAVDLAGHDEIAIYPVGGWWKSHVGQRRMNDTARYSLLISISAFGQPIDLYAEIENAIEVDQIVNEILAEPQE